MSKGRGEGTQVVLHMKQILEFLVSATQAHSGPNSEQNTVVPAFHMRTVELWHTDPA